MDDSMAMAGGLLDWIQVQSLPNMIFFNEINSFLDDEIGEFAGNLLGRVLSVVGAAVLTLLTLWILIQGYRIATGQLREPMMALVTNSLKAVLIIGIATGAAAGAGSIYHTLTNGLTEVVNEVMTGDADGGPYEDIDKTLAIMQVALEVIDSVDTGGDAITDQDKVQALWLAGAGLGGPAIMAATALLLNKIAIALIVGLGPIFILCLLFEPTKPLFKNWLLYGIGTLFSLALLNVMVTLTLDMVIAVGLAFWASSWLPGSEQESLTAMAMQQGGLGLILTLLILSVPPMAAVFFRGVLGHFSAYSAFGLFGATRQSQSIQASDPRASAPMPTTAAEHRHLFGPGPPAEVDRIKSASEMAGSFLTRYPHAIASSAALVGGGDPLPEALVPVVAGTNSPIHVDADGYLQNAGITKHEVAALEKGSIDGPNAIVMHRTVSSTASSTLNSFERGIGTHFLIGKDGTIYQTAGLKHHTAHVGPIRSRCLDEGTCPADEASKLMSYGPRQGHNHEKIKAYPSRYPMNEDSIGIEVVAMYHEDTRSWDVPTNEQTAAINKLVRILKNNYGFKDSDIYAHDTISRKTAGEGQGLYSGDDFPAGVWMLWPKLPPP